MHPESSAAQTFCAPIGHRVFHLLSETEPFSEYKGGAISRWAANVLRGDASSIIVCPSTDDTWGFPESRVLPVLRFHNYRKIRHASSRLPWVIRRQLIRAVLSEPTVRVAHGDILWIHNRPDYAFALAPVVHDAGGRVVLHMHNSHLLEQSAELIRKSGIDHFVFVSSFLQRESLERFPFITNSTVLHNGADEHLFYPAQPTRTARDVPQILFASRLVRDKGAHVFFDAMRLLARSGIDAQGIVVGASHFGGSKTTPYMAELRRTVPPNVELRPYCSGRELAELFRESDIFCAPSIWNEPFGMVNVEAFASGTPVVSTHGGGSKEVFADGGGLLVERGSADQLADALHRLIASPELRLEVGMAGIRSFKKNYTWTVVRERYRKIVDAVPS